MIGARAAHEPVPQEWIRQKERGSALALRFIIAVALTLGRPVARVFAAFAVAWYLVRAWPVHASVFDFLRRALPRRPTLRDLIRSYWYFATVTLDRVFFIAGREECFDIRTSNAGILENLRAQGKGAILLGAHLGSFIALRAIGKRQKKLSIKVLQYREQNPAISEALARLDPTLAADIIPLGEPDVLLRLEQCVAGGGFAAMLGDRMGPRDTRGVTCEFLGEAVTLPSGGVEAALILGCPVVLFFGLYRGGNRYELHFERLETGRFSDRRERHAAAEHSVGRYAARLADYARRAPCNWFNFYPYWR